MEQLTEQEKLIALQILQELEAEGKSATYNALIDQDYNEVPVDIYTFISDDRYLGKAWKKANGELKLFPFWIKQLQDLFPDPYTTSYNNAIFSGARGLGKSEIAITCALYEMYKLMCLKNPHEYLNLKLTEKVAFAFMNITKTLSEEIGISKFQATVQLSPWFMERGTLTGRGNIVWNPPDWINIIIGSQPGHVIGQAIYFAFFDEIDFIRNQDIERQKTIAKEMIDTAIGGMKTRFLHGGKNPTLLILASSKRSEKSFLEEHMKRKLADESEPALIIDKAVWDVRPATDYSGRRFHVGVGNRFLASEIIPDNVNLSDFISKGFTILDVPIEFLSNFKENIDRALCDFAGIASSDLTKYISGIRLQATKRDNIFNPFSKDILEIGNSPDDFNQYYDYFDLAKIPSELKAKPLYIHLDMSISGDKTGIAGVWIIGRRAAKEDSPKELFFQLAFNVSIKAPQGWQISFEKNRLFIYWLKEQGFNIKGISTDTFQNATLAQDLMSKGYNYQIISVDRTNSDHVCEPYLFLKNCIYEQRIAMYHSDLLTEELLGLERNGSTGRIDHPDGGKYGCFTGDTKISLVDGRNISLLELVDEFNTGKQNYVYSFNETTKKIEPKLIENAWCTRKDAELVEVTLDNGEILRCTPNHLFMLRDGHYCEAQNLKENDSLMPLYTKIAKKGLSGYRLYYEPIEDSWHYEHRQFATEVLDKKYLVHHKDCNKLNNNPTNLIWCSKEKHHEFHSNNGTGAYSEEASLKRSKSVSKWHSENKNTEVYLNRSKKLHDATLKQHGLTEDDYLKHQAELQQQHLNGIKIKEQAELNRIQRETQKNIHIKQIEDTFGVIYSTLSETEKNSYGVNLNRLLHPETTDIISAQVSKNHALGKYENAKIALNKSNSESKLLKEMCPVVDEQRFFDIFGFHYADLPSNKKAPYTVKYRRIVCKEILNHKVVSVKNLPYTEDVYDLTVADNHNFALAAGVFVHNSKDSADATCGALWNAAQHGDEYAFDYGETLEATIEANSVRDDYTKDQLVLDFEEMLKSTVAFIPAPETYSAPGFQMDFGAGRAQKTDYSDLVYASQGILLS